MWKNCTQVSVVPEYCTGYVKDQKKPKAIISVRDSSASQDEKQTLTKVSEMDSVGLPKRCLALF